MIKTSVIIPLYNTEEYIGECLESVLQQTQKDIEIIVVDDGSTDRSLEVVKEYQKENDNLKVVCQENKKLGAARNFGMSLAAGEYICFLDSDDLLEKNALEELYKKASVNNLDFVTYDLKCFGGDEADEKRYRFYDRSCLGIEDRVYRGVDFWKYYEKEHQPVISACSLYLSRRFVERYDFRFQENLFHEDNEFTIRVYLKAERIMYIPEKFYERRLRPGSIMKSKIGFYHFKGILSNIKLIFYHLKTDSHKADEKVEFLNFWEAQLRKASSLWISFEGKEKQELSIIIRDALKEMTEGTFLLEVMHKQLYLDLSEFLEHLLIEDYEKEKVQMLKETLASWYEDNIELFQSGYSRKYLEALQSKDGVILYGAGIVGQRFANWFQLKYWENVIGFAVSDLSAQESKVCGLSVSLIDDLAEYRDKANVFITTGPKLHEEIEANLLEKGFKNIYPVDWKKLMESTWI